MGQGTSLPYSKDGTGIIASVAMNEFTSNLSYIELIIGGQPTSFSFDFTDEISGAVYLLGNAQVDYSVTYSASIYSGGTSYGQETEEINGSYSSYGDYFDFGGGTIQPTQVNYDVGFSSQSSPQYIGVLSNLFTCLPVITIFLQ